MTIREIYIETKKCLHSCGITNPEFEARTLIEETLSLGNGKMFLHLNTSIEDSEHISKISDLTLQRKIGKPLQYLIGKWEFMGIPMLVGEGVLIPRSDTETLIEKIKLEYSADFDGQILDLCSGSGCIAISLAKIFPNSQITAVEYSNEAFDYLKKNIILNGIKNIFAINADAFESNTFSDESFDIIASNPPYLTTSEMLEIPVEVSFEPPMALDGGKDGLHFYRELSKKYSQKLVRKGMICFEVGYQQANIVSEMLSDNQYTQVSTATDLNGIKRVVSGRRK